MKSSKKYYVIAIIAFLLFFLLHNTDWIVDRESPANFFKFLGRFHPLVVHFPIVLILLSLVLDWYSKKRNNDALKNLTTWIIGATALFSFVSIYIGMMLSAGENYDEDILEWHERFAVLLALCSTLAFLFKATALKNKSWSSSATSILLLAGVVFMTIGADKGGTLTHGTGYLTKYLFNEEEKVVDWESASIYDSIVQPILNEKCAKCHSADRTEGGLLLTSSEAFIEGGDDGPIIVEGSPANSEIIRRMVLPMDNRFHMPPAGEQQLTPRESELIRWWIETGASFETPLPENETTDMADLILDEMGLSDMPTGVFALDIAAADSNEVNNLRSSTGALIMPLAESINLIQVATTNVQKTFNSDNVKELADLKDQITWLDLGATQVDDQALSSIGEMTYLTKLHLEKTAVTDDALKHLSGLEYLEYLNLYGTEITDAGLEHIKDLPKLRSLFLWQSKVTKEGADKLRNARPDIDINTGADLSPLSASPEETSAN